MFLNNMNIDEILKKGKEVGVNDVVDKGRVIKQPEVEQPKESIIGGLKSDIQERGKKVAESYERQKKGEQTPMETGLQLAGQTVGASFDVFGRALQGAFRSMPDFLENPIRNTSKTIAGTVLNTEVGRQALEAIHGGIEEYQLWKERHPRAAANIESTINIASLFPVRAGVKIAARAVPFVGEFAGKTAQTLEKGLQKQVSREALEIIKPVLNKQQRISALESGRATQTGRIFKGIDLVPSEIDKKVAKAVEDVVSKSKSAVDNLDAITTKIKVVSEEVGKELKNNNSIFNKNQFKSILENAKEESKVVFASDLAEEKAYNSIIDEMMRIQAKRKSTISDLWEARKEFDSIIEQKFPKVFDKIAGDNIRSNAIMDVRRAVNDFIGSRLPEGNMFKGTLKELSSMYQARTNIATKVQGIVGKPKLKRIIDTFKENQAVYLATGGILTFGALTGILTNPIVMGSLLIGGSVKVGKAVVTSKLLKKSLIQFMKGLERKALPKTEEGLIKFTRDKQAVQEIIDTIDEQQIGLSIRDVSRESSFKSGEIPEKLLQEARKYKSAEEFVEGQQKLFRGGEKLDVARINDEGVPFSVDNKVAEQFARIKNQFDAGSVGQALGKKPGQNIVESFYITPEAKIATRADVPDEVFNAYKQANPLTKPNVAEPIINKWAKENGFDAIDYRTLGKTSTKEAEIKILNPNVLKTKSQLTDIWNKANKK